MNIMKKFILSTFIVLTLIIIPTYTKAETNSGFIPGQIWYSKQTLTEGETVNIHTAVWNSEKDPISAKVEFYDKNVLLGARDITVASLELKDVSISWKITAGDHLISAKITSSTATVGGKKENIVLGRVSTSSDKQVVSVVVKNNKGESITETNPIKTQLENTGEKINDLLPEKVSTTISDTFVVVEDFRDRSYVSISEEKAKTKIEVDAFNNEETTLTDTTVSKKSIEDGTKKPITYIKLFLLSVLTFIFGNKYVFYGLIIFIVFLILRFIFRRIRNK